MEFSLPKIISSAPHVFCPRRGQPILVHSNVFVSRATSSPLHHRAIRI